MTQPVVPDENDGLPAYDADENPQTLSLDRAYNRLDNQDYAWRHALGRGSATRPLDAAKADAKPTPYTDPRFGIGRGA